MGGQDDMIELGRRSGDGGEEHVASIEGGRDRVDGRGQMELFRRESGDDAIDVQLAIHKPQVRGAKSEGLQFDEPASLDAHPGRFAGELEEVVVVHETEVRVGREVE